MGNIIQDIIGLVTRAKPVTPRDKDVIALGRFKDGFRDDNVSGPSMIAEQTTLKKVSDYIVAKVPNELPNPGTEGQVLALDSNLDPIWKDDADTTSTIFQTSDVPSSFNYKGDVYIPTGTGVNLTRGSVHYLADSGGGNDRLAVVNDVTSAAQMTAFVGIAFDRDDTLGVLIKGIINLGSDPGGNIGDPVYLTGSGALSATAPSGAGEYVRVMGHNLGNNKVFFNPSQDFILLS